VIRAEQDLPGTGGREGSGEGEEGGGEEGGGKEGGGEGQGGEMTQTMHVNK
jgi:hypothetical protein